MVHTPWHSSVDDSSATTLDVALRKLPPQADYSFVLTVGIRFGAWTERGVVKEVKRDGAAKILRVQSGHADGNADSGKIDNGPAIESVRLPKEKKQTTSRKKPSSGKGQVLQPTASHEISTGDVATPTVSDPTSSQYAASAKSVNPKKQKPSRLAVQKIMDETAPIYKERGEAYSSQYGYFSTMTLAMNTRVVYVTT